MKTHTTNILKSLLFFVLLTLTFKTMMSLGNYIQPNPPITLENDAENNTFAKVVEKPSQTPTFRSISDLTDDTGGTSAGGSSSGGGGSSSGGGSGVVEPEECEDFNFEVKKQYLCDEKKVSLFMPNFVSKYVGPEGGEVNIGGNSSSTFINLHAVVRVTEVWFPKSLFSGSKAPYDSLSRPTKENPGAPSLGSYFNTNVGEQSDNGEDVTPEVSFYSRIPGEEKKERPSFAAFALWVKSLFDLSDSDEDGKAVAKGVYEAPLYNAKKWVRDYKKTLAVNPKATNVLAEDWYNLWRSPGNEWTGRDYQSTECADYSDIVCDVDKSYSDALSKLCIAKVPKSDKYLSLIYKIVDYLSCLSLWNPDACSKHAFVGVYISSPLGTNTECSSDSCASKTIAHAQARFTRIPKEEGMYQTKGIPDDAYDIGLKSQYLTVPCKVVINGDTDNPVDTKCFYDITYLSSRYYNYKAFGIPKDKDLPTQEEYNKMLCDIAKGFEPIPSTK